MPASDAESAPRRGRPRSDAARRAIIDATVAALHEGGYSALSIEGVAARAGVAKRTIYRWWDSKGALAVDAYLQAAATEHPEPDSGSAQGDVEALLRRLFRTSTVPAAAAALRSMMIEAQQDPAFGQEFARFISARRLVLKRILERGIQRGELRPDIDVETAVDCVFGPFWYRLLSPHGPLDEHFARVLSSQVLNGLR